MADTMEVLTTVDIGSHSLKGIVASFEGGQCEVLAYSRVKSRGYEQGELKDIVALRESLESLLKDLSEQLPRRMECDFTIHMVDHSITLINEVKTISIGGTNLPVEITEDHVIRLFEKMNTLSDDTETQDSYSLVGAKRSILHVIPRKYLLDNVKSVLNPLDMEASSLGMEAAVITMDNTMKESLGNAFSAVLGQKPTVYSAPFVSSEVVLNSMEKERGVVCLDLGHSFTSISAYLNGSIFFMKTFELGFKLVIKDIAQVFHTSFDEAERLLNTFGKISLKQDSSETISYTLLDGKTSKQMSRSQLSIVIYAKIREIMNAIKREMRHISARMSEEGEKTIAGGIVLTGGGAKLEGIQEFTRDIFKLPVRSGNPGSGNFRVNAPEEPLQNPLFSGCFGSAYWYHLVGGSSDEDSFASEEHPKKKKAASKPVKEKPVKQKPGGPARKEGPTVFEKIVEFLKKLV